MKSFEPLIEKLNGWREELAGFHEDRQLADEVLVADGWRVIQDATFEGGIRWSFGKCPEVSVADSHRPHVINDLNAAVSLVPVGCYWRLQNKAGTAEARVWVESLPKPNPAPGEPILGVMYGEGVSQRPSVALVIAVLKFKELHRFTSRN